MKKILTLILFGRYRLIPINETDQLYAIIHACQSRLKLIKVSDEKLFNAVEKDEVLNLLKEGSRILKNQ